MYRDDGKKKRKYVRHKLKQWQVKARKNEKRKRKEEKTREKKKLQSTHLTKWKKDKMKQVNGKRTFDNISISIKLTIKRWISTE